MMQGQALLLSIHSPQTIFNIDKKNLNLMTNVEQTMNYRPVQTFEKGMLRLKGKV